jgi:hypothetical protein
MASYVLAGYKAFARTRRRLAKRRLAIAGDSLCGAQQGARRGVKGAMSHGCGKVSGSRGLHKDSASAN